jgi:hypothetical protein
MQTDAPSYFLFPHMTLTEDDLRNFSIFLPNLNILEIIRPAVIPEWLQDRFHGHPVIREDDFSARIDSCVKGYHAFAEVHGGRGGILAFLSQTREDTSETRLRIQEELRGKGLSHPDEAYRKIFQAAVFLEIARELDEKELELEGSYVELNALEREFRGILGIAGEDEADAAEATLSPPLVPDRAGSLFMLPTRIESWFHLFFTHPVESVPVFVANHPDVLSETFEMICSRCAGGAAEFSPVRISLGSFPRLDQLGRMQFRSLIEAPGTPGLLEAYRRDLDNFLKEAAGAKNPDELESKSGRLKHRLDEFCSRCDLGGANRVNLSFYFMENVSLADFPEFSGSPGGQTGSLSHGGNSPALFLCICSQRETNRA